MSEFNITLPSRGRLYGDKLPGGNLTLKPLTTKEQSILFNPTGDTIQKFDSILNNCIVKSPIPVQDMLMTDRLYVMIILRTRSFGSIYKIPSMRCSSCKSQYSIEVDLSKDLKVKVYDKESVDDTYLSLGDNIEEPICFHLSDFDSDVEYRFLRGYDERQIAQNSKRMLMQSTDISDPSFQLRLMLMIQKINGNEMSMQEKTVFVNSMSARDETLLSADIDLKESGMDLTFISACRSCGNEEESVLPFTAEFFRPKRIR
jgi:hypothetical protein